MWFAMCGGRGASALSHFVATSFLAAAVAACGCLPLGQAETCNTAEVPRILRSGSLRSPNPLALVPMVTASLASPPTPAVAVDQNPADPWKDSVEKHIDIDATQDECFMIASGFEDYERWAGVHHVEVLGKGGKAGHGIANLVSMQVAMFGLQLTYVLSYENDRPRSMKWHAVSGSIKALAGSYIFTPLGSGRTRVTYRLSVDPGFYLPHAIRMATNRMVVSCALKELKRFIETPATKAMLQNKETGGKSLMKQFFQVPRTLSAEAESMTNPRVWQLTPLL